jgi:hypothetical protein
MYTTNQCTAMTIPNIFIRDAVLDDFLGRYL